MNIVNEIWCCLGERTTHWLTPRFYHNPPEGHTAWRNKNRQKKLATSGSTDLRISCSRWVHNAINRNALSDGTWEGSNQQIYQQNMLPGRASWRKKEETIKTYKIKIREGRVLNYYAFLKLRLWFLYWDNIVDPLLIFGRNFEILGELQHLGSLIFSHLTSWEGGRARTVKRALCPLHSGFSIERHVLVSKNSPYCHLAEKEKEFQKTKRRK